MFPCMNEVDEPFMGFILRLYLGQKDLLERMTLILLNGENKNVGGERFRFQRADIIRAGHGFIEAFHGRFDLDRCILERQIFR